MARGPHIRSDWFNTNVVNRVVAGLRLTSSVTVRGRKSGRRYTVPVHVLDFQGARYLVAPRGDVEWVRNARAAGEIEVRIKGVASRPERFRVVPVTGEATHPLIDEYRRRWGRELSNFWEKLPEYDQHPVFELKPGPA